MAEMLTISQLKKHLKALSPQELVKLICQLYKSLCSVFGNVVENINKAQSEEVYVHLKTRLQKLVSETQDIGWGYGFYVMDAFCQIAWRESDE